MSHSTTGENEFRRENASTDVTLLLYTALLDGSSLVVLDSKYVYVFNSTTNITNKQLVCCSVAHTDSRNLKIRVGGDGQ